jgi:hypothetical protein
MYGLGGNMKVYEIGIPSDGNDQSFEIWIATDRNIEATNNDPNVYIKEIEEYDEHTSGVDFIIK